MEHTGFTDKDYPSFLRTLTAPDAGSLPRDLNTAHRASVLIPLVYENGEWCLLFEVRAYDLDVQPGDVCFPGGGTEAGETPEESVLREAAEELLIEPSQVELLTCLPDVVGPRDTVVTPFVGILHGYKGTFFRGETDHVFTVPLAWFPENEPLVNRRRIPPPDREDFPYELIYGGMNYPFSSSEVVTYFYRHPDEVIWGFTAKLVKLFLLLITPAPR